MEISSIQLQAHESPLDQIKNDLHELREQYLALTEGMSGHEFARKPYLKQISTLMFHLEALLGSAQTSTEIVLIWEKSRTSYHASKKHIENILASPIDDGAIVVTLQGLLVALDGFIDEIIEFLTQETSKKARRVTL